MTMPLHESEFDANLNEPGNDAIVGVRHEPEIAQEPDPVLDSHASFPFV